MPSLTDIPVDLMTPAQKPRFILWVRSLPVPLSVRRTLLYLWKKKTGAVLEPTDYAAATENAPPG